MCNICTYLYICLYIHSCIFFLFFFEGTHFHLTFVLNDLTWSLLMPVHWGVFILLTVAKCQNLVSHCISCSRGVLASLLGGFLVSGPLLLKQCHNESLWMWATLDLGWFISAIDSWKWTWRVKRGKWERDIFRQGCILLHMVLYNCVLSPAVSENTC